MATNEQIGEDVAVLKNDMQWVKESVGEISTSMKTVTNILTEGEGKIKAVKKEIFGNGDPKSGLKHRVNELESQRDQAKGIIKFLGWASGILGASNVFFIAKMILESL